LKSNSVPASKERFSKTTHSTQILTMNAKNVQRVIILFKHLFFLLLSMNARNVPPMHLAQVEMLSMLTKDIGEIAIKQMKY